MRNKLAALSHLMKPIYSILNSCFETTASLTTLERSALYYISGYVAFKEDINVGNSEELTNSLDSEFTTLVSRGMLRHPPNYMYDLSLYL